MRVLFISSSSGSQGGGELYLKYLGAALVEAGVEVGFWIADDRQMDALAKALEAVGPVMRSRYTNTFLRRGRSLAHLLPNTAERGAALAQWRSFGADIWHLNKQCLEDGLDLLKWVRGEAPAQLCTVHITQTAVELKAALAWLRDSVARRAFRRYPGALLAISEQRARALARFVRERRSIHTVSNGVALPEAGAVARQRAAMRGALGMEAGQVLAVSVGRLEPQKNPLKFVDWVGQLHARDAQMRAIWVGDGRLRGEFEGAVEAAGLKDVVRCVGWVDSVGAYLAAADIYLHPADFEGLPFALLEAMAYRLPCVLSKLLADELMEMPRETWLVPEDGEGSWVEALMDAAQRASYATAAYDLCTERYSHSSMAQSTLDVYRKILKSG